LSTTEAPRKATPEKAGSADPPVEASNVGAKPRPAGTGNPQPAAADAAPVRPGVAASLAPEPVQSGPAHSGAEPAPEPAPAGAEALARVEASESQPPAAVPVDAIRLRVASRTEQRIDLEVRQRQGAVEVRMQASDPSLSESVHAGLPGLFERLGADGWDVSAHADLTHAGAANDAAEPNPGAAESQTGTATGQRGGSGRQGQERDGAPGQGPASQNGTGAFSSHLFSLAATREETER
jgi:hypothetical protein